MQPSNNHTPRVAIVYQLDRVGGVQSCAFSLIRGLNQRGIIPDILWDKEPNWALLHNMKAEAGFRSIPFRIPTRVIGRMPDSVRYLLKIANTVDGDALKNQYDFFYVFYNGFLLSPQVPHVRYLSGPPLVPQLARVNAGIQGAPMRAFRWLYQNVLRTSHPVYEYHRDSRYVINSQFTARLFEQAHGDTLPVVHPPIQVPEQSFQEDDWDRRDTITFFSRIIGYKRPEWVLDLVNRYTQFRGVIMGGVPDHRRPYFESLERKAEDQGLNQVTLLANPSNERVCEELARTRFYVFPARNEHFGMTTVEAIAAGALPFVHDSGGQREIVPFDQLRFSDEDFLPKFEALQALNLAEVNELRRALFAHISRFAEDHFVEKMLAYLDE